MQEDIENWSLEKLRRKRDQAWEMAGMARQDGDKVDEEKHTKDARKYQVEISTRVSYE